VSVKPNAVIEVAAPGGPPVRIGNREPLSIIAGPCQMESRQHALETAHALKEMARRLGLGLIYKTSFDKANRTSGERPRGVSFGYNTLISDMRALPIMAEIGCPIVFDATHSVQQPGGAGDVSSGERRFVPVLARAAVAVGVAAVFLETHEDPDHAPSDGPNMIPLKSLEPLLRELMDYDALAKRRAAA
jgi:3-deoxy-D-manno-octulosonic acid (KDO) 8-phosphate synthase